MNANGRIKPGVLWGRAIAFGILAQLIVLVAIFGSVLAYAAVASPTQLEMDRLFPRLAGWIGMGGGGILALLLARRVARKSGSAHVLNGVVLGGSSAGVSAVVAFVAGTQLSAPIVIAWVVRLVAGATGGAWAAREASKEGKS